MSVPISENNTPPAPFVCSVCEHHGAIGEPAFLLDNVVVCRQCQDSLRPVCPHCDQVMVRRLPRTHGLCPACRERFYIQSDQWLFNTSILTRTQKESLYQLDRERRELQEFDITDADRIEATRQARSSGRGGGAALAWIRDKAARMIARDEPGLLDEVGTEGVMLALNSYRTMMHRWKSGPVPGLSLHDALLQIRRLKLRFRQMPSASDIVCGMFNSAVLLPENRDCLDSLYFGLAFHLACDGRGYAHIMKEGWRAKARRWAEDGVSHVEVLPDGPGICAAAKRNAGKKIAINEAVAEPPIPSPRCNADPMIEGGPPWCGCCLTTILPDWKEPEAV